VLAISGPYSDTEEVGVAVGLPAILELVEEGLRNAVQIGGGREGKGTRH
jgi:hypothetical protein